MLMYYVHVLKNFVYLAVVMTLLSFFFFIKTLLFICAVIHEPNGPQETSQYEHSSIPATVKKLFNLHSNFLTKRDAWAGTFENYFKIRKTPRTDCPGICLWLLFGIYFMPMVWTYLSFIWHYTCYRQWFFSQKGQVLYYIVFCSLSYQWIGVTAVLTDQFY